MIRSKDGDQNDLEHGEDLEQVSSNDQENRLGLNTAQFPLLLVLVTSFILMLAVVTWEGEIKSKGYALSVPVLSMVLSIGYIALTFFKQELYSLHGKNMTYGLFMWNFVGACFLTFSSPFTTTGNGYFAAWGCVATSAMAMGFTGDAFRSRVEGLGSLMGLVASSAIIIIALIDFVGAGAKDRKNSMYALVVATFSIVLVFGLLFLQKSHGGTKAFAKAKFSALALFAFLWLILSCLVTFAGPFSTTGNGYFASWVGASCAFFAAYASWKEMGISTEDVVGFLSPASNGDGPTGLSATIT